MPLAIDTVLLEPISTDPSTPVEGTVWYNTTTKKMRVQGASSSRDVFMSGGDTAGESRTLGNTDAYDLSLVTGGVARFTAQADGVVRASGDLHISVTGSTLASPRIVGAVDLVAGTGCRYQFGDSNNAWQNGFDQAMQIWAYHTLILEGDRNTVGTMPMETTSDVNVLIRNNVTTSPMLVLKKMVAQTADIIQVRDPTEAVIAKIDVNGYISPGVATTIDPLTPTAGTTVFGRTRAGRSMTGQVDPSGSIYIFQPSLFANKVTWFTPQGNGTTVTSVNYGNSTTGTVTAANVATTSFFTSLRRVSYVTINTLGNSAGTRHNLAQFWRGNAAKLGGFFMVVRFGISQTKTGYRWFVGMSATTGALGNVQPSTFLNILGLGQDTGDANIQFMHNDGTGAATKVDLGVSWPRPTAATQFYEFRLCCPSNGTNILWSLENLDPSAPAITGGDTTLVPTDIPSTTTLLSPQIWINNGTTNGVAAIDVASLYIETDN
jgi:hypothetical protein